MKIRAEDWQQQQLGGGLGRPSMAVANTRTTTSDEWKTTTFPNPSSREMELVQTSKTTEITILPFLFLTPTLPFEYSESGFRWLTRGPLQSSSILFLSLITSNVSTPHLPQFEVAIFVEFRFELFSIAEGVFSYSSVFGWSHIAVKVFSY